MSAWLQHMKELSTQNLVRLHDELEQGTSITSNCLSIIYKPTNSESGEQISNSRITLTSTPCTNKKAVACKLDKPEASKGKPIPFPCIPGNSTARKKRNSENDNETDSNGGNWLLTRYVIIL